MPWLRLIRWPNLLIIALTQFVAWWCIIWPHRAAGLVLTPVNFLLLCSSTVLIAAGGYIINDYFDIRIDVINKPEKVILERDIPRRLAIIVHSFLNILALALAALVALPAGHPEWLLLQLACSGMLWRYSTTWKRQFMIGNVVVALMTALSVLILFCYEKSMYPLLFQPAMVPLSKARWRINPVAVLAGFALFAFILTWMREIVKDMEDYKGDDHEGCVTMPIRWGLLKSSRFVQLLGLITCLILISCAYRLTHTDFRYFFLAGYIYLILLPAIIAWMILLSTKVSSKHYHRCSTLLKYIMILGIATVILYRLT